MSPAPSIRVLLADDDDILREGFAALLSSAPGIELVDAVADGAAALGVLEERLVDVALLDVEMPRLDGIQTARIIAQRFPRVAVVMLTAYDEPQRTGQALRAGALGFLTKDLPVEQVVHALEQASLGIAVLAPGPARTALGPMRSAGAGEGDGLVERIESLPARYRPVLDEVLRGRSNREIARGLGMSEATVRTYMSEILRHCDCRSRTELAVRAVRAGLS